MKFSESMNGSVNLGESLTLRGMQMGREFHPFNARSSRISLKQWKMFQAVVDFDGFTGAASHLHISQSAISYTLAKLQEQLGVSLLKIEGRKAQITEEGKILLDRSRDLVRNAMELEVLAENLRHGWGPEIRLAVDPSFPPQLLMLALRKLFPHSLNIRLSVEEMTLYQANIALHERTADLAITTQVPIGFEGSELIEIEHIAVAHPEHPLFCLKRQITLDDLEKQVQIVISGSGDRVSANANHLLPGYSRLWNVNGVDTAIDALRHGLGYAWLPKYRVQRWLDENKISILPLNNGASYKSHLHIIFGSSVGPKSGAKRFADVLCKLAENGPFPVDPKTS
ncbi:LysR family transcriptional regulator [Noviherbaspirillum sedimenti]|uniref:LysR family transcriptional regulator n=1 Tax=Noviherbaspirillum sedimenti TaxID=2320865 RepID=A0A3A3G050_9BURK|nr:LysR family transcriptional regulator [Noviherbaspirillum sedimenti]RJG01294.1 LysR family transcriptional regulator [Noviherbaspirillum sedimenti]